MVNFGPLEVLLILIIVGLPIGVLIALLASRKGSASATGNQPAVIALVVGILGIVFLPALAPIAWWQGIVGRRKVSRGETHENQGLAIAGQALGIIGTVLLAVYVTALVVLFA